MRKALLNSVSARSFIRRLVLLSVTAWVIGCEDDKNSNSNGTAGSGGTPSFSDDETTAGNAGVGGGGETLDDTKDTGEPETLIADDEGDDTTTVTDMDADAGSCAGQAYKAVVVPLDIHIMLDRSLSMNESADGSTTKWEAVKSAIKAFLSDPESEGLGVGLHFFPNNPTCTTDEECPGSYCYLNVCDNTLDFKPCRTDDDCPGTSAGTCVPLGNCGPDSCRNVGGSCDEGDAGPTCQPVTQSVCVTEDTCGLEGYVQPSVPIERLPEASERLLESLDYHEPVPLPFGFTPTGPALEGALAYSKQWAKEHTTHRVLTLLATDGSPTQCAPSGTSAVAALASVGAGTSPRVQTYTVGVFANDDDEGPKNLEAVALEGDGEAFIIDDSDNVAARFIEALDSIRGEGLKCEFQVPEPEDGQKLDYGRVNVELYEKEELNRLPFLESPEDCDEDGGWYYDVNPSKDVKPQKIQVCESNCNTLEHSRGARVEISVGCVSYKRPLDLK